MNMDKDTLLKKIQHQYDFSPYPHHPMEQARPVQPDELFVYNLTTPYYLRNRQVAFPGDRVILDAGCGSGYKALTLAQANPGAQIVGVDISEASIQVARQRFASLGLENVRFEVMGIEDIASLGLEFDYINCDEVLYLVPDAPSSLKSLSAVLKPQGILRGNLHSLLQRKNFFRAQKAFEILGLMNNPESKEIQMTQHILKALKDQVDLKQKMQSHLVDDLSQPEKQQSVLMNLLLQNDQGFTIPQMFALLQDADLEFISMVRWPQWNLTDLFQVAPHLLAVYGLHPSQLAECDRLHLYELLHPVHRLLDFWCGRSGVKRDRPLDGPLAIGDGANVRIHLHPQLRTPEVKATFLSHIASRTPLTLSNHLRVPAAQDLHLDTLSLATLLPLHDGPQSFSALVARWLQVCPIDLTTLETINPDRATTELSTLLSQLERCLYILLEAQ